MSTPAAPADASTFAGGVQIPLWRSILVLLIGLGTYFLCSSSSNVTGATESGVNMKLPIFLDQFMGQDQEVSLAEKTLLPGDTEFAKKVYSTLRGEYVSCQVVLSGGEKRSIHRPETCLPGQGWTISDAREVPVRLSTGQTQTVMKLTLTRTYEVAQGDRRTMTNIFYYWFVGKDKTTAEHSERVLLTVWDRVFHNVNHRWAYVIVSGVVADQTRPGAKSETQTVEMLEKFIAKIAPQIQNKGVIPK
ncbi:MAG TPA: EpsI family protein [Chthoniobacterales bacterium]|jgi:EpsI family protein